MKKTARTQREADLKTKNIELETRIKELVSVIQDITQANTKTMRYKDEAIKQLRKEVNELQKKTNSKYNGWTNYETWRMFLEFFDGYKERVNEEELREQIAVYIEHNAIGEMAKGWAEAFAEKVNYEEIVNTLNTANGYDKEE